MSDLLKKIYNACDPYEPATQEHYYNCAKARGDNALTQRFQANLSQTQSGKYLRFLLSGHIVGEA